MLAHLIILQKLELEIRINIKQEAKLSIQQALINDNLEISAPKMPLQWTLVPNLELLQLHNRLKAQ